MSNNPFQEIMQSHGGRRVMPTGNPSSNTSYRTPRNPVREIERAIADITRFQTYLMNAITMARMTVFAVRRDRTVTMIAGEPSHGRRPSLPGTSGSMSGVWEKKRDINTVLQQLIPTSDIQPFLEGLESVMNGQSLEASEECEIGTLSPRSPNRFQWYSIH